MSRAFQGSGVRHRWFWVKPLLWAGMLVLGLTASYQFAAVWLEYHLLYGPEQQLVRVLSPDGRQAAHFSVKYEGPYPWWPANPQPHFYITVTDVDSGRVHLRQTDFDWPQVKAYRSAGNSFADLARVYAPWAEPRFQPDREALNPLKP